MPVNAQRNIYDETAPVQAQLSAAPVPTVAPSPVAPVCPCFICSHRKAIAVALVVVIVLLALSGGSVRAGG